MEVYEFLRPNVKINLLDVDNDINKLFFDRFTCKIDEVYSPSTIFFFIDDVFYIKYHRDSGYLWCSYKLIWKYISDNYDIEYESQISFKLLKLFTRYMKRTYPEIEYNYIKTDPSKIYDELSLKIEEHFNKKCS